MVSLLEGHVETDTQGRLPVMEERVGGWMMRLQAKDAPRLTPPPKLEETGRGLPQAAVPNLFVTRDQFCEKQFFHRQEGGWIIQAVMLAMGHNGKDR